MLRQRLCVLRWRKRCQVDAGRESRSAWEANRMDVRALCARVLEVARRAQVWRLRDDATSKA
jgi:hypothetical protein